MSNHCPFCQIASNDYENRIRLKSDYGFAIRDGFPLTEGHTLVVSNNHVSSFFDLSVQVQSDLLNLVSSVRSALVEEYGIKDINIGINDGPLAGQTVAHCHIHIIPRRDGDVVDPRGGIRWILPKKADYWS